MAGRKHTEAELRRIGIIGAGLGGLAAGALLARAGFDITIMEAAGDPVPMGAGLLLQPPGQDVLRRLGLLEPLLADGAIVTRLDARTKSGQRLLDLDYRRLHPGLHGLGLTRAAIWRGLLDTALSAGCTLLAGCRIVGMESSASGAMAEDSGGGRHCFDLLLVANGSGSVLAARWPRRRSVAYPWGCLWTQIILPDGWPPDVLQQRVLAATKMLGVLPTGRENGRPVAALYWSVHNDRVAAEQSMSPATWRSGLEQLWPEVSPMVRNLGPGDLKHAVYRDVWVDPPFQGRILLIGDAAHGTSPQLGQGTTQALLDAALLTDCLIQHEADPITAFPAYWRKRRARTRYYRWASRLLTPMYQSDSRLFALARDFTAWPARHLPLVDRLALRILAGAKTGLFGWEEPPP